MLTSTPLPKAQTHEAHAELSLAESREKETKVHLTIQYPSKTIRKVLKDDYAVRRLCMALQRKLPGQC